ncbi:MAG: Gfo/Idh/MocA family oxidoreductase [Acidobacteria bacterium]|nr:Gfo/Idh/MocA family oxidoreductase [Acidobacteriota bacterium]
MGRKRFTRRDFMKLGAGGAALGAAARVTLLDPGPLWSAQRTVAPSDTLRYGIIGTGIRGCNILRGARRVSGIELVAVCDLYESRHQAGREAIGKDVPGTREYKEILDRKDIDAVIIATMDHWHRPILEEACAAGKDVYCEKPMSHTVEDGFAMVKAAQDNRRMVQVGSQRVSSILYAKAREIYQSGKLGQVTTIDAYWDRNTASGAWVYPVPSDSSAEAVNWDRYLGNAPKRPYDPLRFFRWRCYQDYGEGLAGDLFVHLISGIHLITGTNSIPSRAQSTGGLFRWKDGREFPDLIWTFYDYPNFRVGMRCNLNNEGGEFIGFYGTKGTMIIRNSTLTYTPQDTRPRPEGYSINGWPAKLRNEYLAKYRREHPRPDPLHYSVDAEGESFEAPPGYSDTSDHLANFFNSIRTRKSPVENEVFGNNASIGCHLSNYSYFNKTVAVWDEASKTIKG